MNHKTKALQESAFRRKGTVRGDATGEHKPEVTGGFAEVKEDEEVQVSSEEKMGGAGQTRPQGKGKGKGFGGEQVNMKAKEDLAAKEHSKGHGK